MLKVLLHQLVAPSLAYVTPITENFCGLLAVIANKLEDQEVSLACGPLSFLHRHFMSQFVVDAMPMGSRGVISDVVATTERATVANEGAKVIAPRLQLREL